MEAYALCGWLGAVCVFAAFRRICERQYERTLQCGIVISEGGPAGLSFDCFPPLAIPTTAGHWEMTQR